MDRIETVNSILSGLLSKLSKAIFHNQVIFTGYLFLLLVVPSQAQAVKALPSDTSNINLKVLVRRDLVNEVSAIGTKTARDQKLAVLDSTLTNLVLDTIQVVAERPLLSEFDLPGFISSVKIKRTGSFRDLAELLLKESGTWLKSYGGGEALQTLSLRGLGAEHTLITLDGIPVNNPQLGLLDLSAFFPGSFSSMEIYRGGQSTLFGSGAIGGVVNLIPVARSADRFQLSSASGAYGLSEFGSTLYLPLGKTRHVIQYFTRYSPNHYRFVLEGKTGRRLNSDFHRWQGNYLTNFPLTANQWITFQFLINKNVQGAPNAIRHPENYQGRGRLQSQNWFSRLKWQGKILQNWKSEMQLYLNRNWMDYNNADIVINRQPLSSHHFTEGMGVITRNMIQLNARHRLLGGVELHRERVISSEVQPHTRWRWAIWETGEWIALYQPPRSLSIFYAFRWENYSDFGTIRLPKIGARYTTGSKYIYASVGENFRAPTFNDLYWKEGGNPELQPEFSRSAELGVGVRGNFFFNYDFKGAAYFIRLKNMIRWLPNSRGIWQPENLDRVFSRGIELNLMLKFLQPHLLLNLSYQYGLVTRTASANPVERNGVRLPYIPATKVVGSLQYRWKGLFLGTEFFYSSFRYTTFANRVPEFLPSFSTVNISIEYRIKLEKIWFTLYGRLENLNRAEYQFIDGYPLPYQPWKAGVRIHWRSANLESIRE